MATTNITCNFCGNVVRVDDTQTGAVICPACGEPVDAHRPAPVAPEGYQRTTKTCPACGTVMVMAALFCSQCGYHWGGTQTKARSTGSSWLQNRALTIALLAGIGLLLLVILFQGIPLATTTRPSSPDGTPEGRAGPDMAELLLSRPKDAPATRIPPSTPASDEAEALLADADPAYTADELAEMEKRYRLKLTQQLDKRYPPFARGDTVALRRTNGRMQRGTFIGVKSDVVVLASDGESSEVPLEELDRDTRVRCDPAFRDRVIASRLRKLTRQLRNL